MPESVIVETDHLLRARLGGRAARLFLSAVANGEHEVAFLTPRLLRRAVGIDSAFPELGLGFTDASVMALAERHDLPILTFDFEDFRAAAPKDSYWRLVIDESRYAEATRPGSGP